MSLLTESHEDPIGSDIMQIVIQRTVSQAKGELSALVEAALAGEEVILSRAGKAVVRIVPFGSDGRTRKSGGLKHLVLPANFDQTDESIIVDFVPQTTLLDSPDCP